MGEPETRLTENGHDIKTSRLSDFIELLEDHVELVSLEWRYETARGVRLLLAVGVGALLISIAFVLLQVAIICALVRAGAPLGWVCFGMALLYGAIGAGVFAVWGRRDPRAGEPFQGSREQLIENLRWIQKLFS